MNKFGLTIELLSLIPVILLLGVSLFYFIVGNRRITKESKTFRYISLSAIGITLTNIFILYYYHDRVYNNSLDRIYQILSNKDNLDISNENLTKEILQFKLDSLMQIDQELDYYLMNIQKQQKVLGDKTYLINELKEAMDKNNDDIEKVIKYNEIMDDYKHNIGHFPYYKSGNSSNFELIEPDDYNSNYIDIILIFHDPELVEKIETVCIHVQKKSGKEYFHIYNQYYKPRPGKNIFKIKNYLKQKDVEVDVGYFLKSEMKKETPTFECITLYSKSQ